MTRRRKNRTEAERRRELGAAPAAYLEDALRAARATEYAVVKRKAGNWKYAIPVTRDEAINLILDSEFQES